ncbi:MAG: hypothetical protein IJD81_01565 [Oscillospiraceae bacterium]|nr:hypothetical protein [Oscillospiraceae bacterium]
MGKRKRSGLLMGIWMPVLAVIVLLCFLSGLSNLSRGHADEDKQRLEDVVRRAAVACYAAEGMYPPNLEYLEEHYGIQVNHSRYVVDYISIAENLMPDITVLEK